jgi:tRNA pseudouridine38-40 synthase
MRTFKLTLAYDGSQYSGWQLQPGRVTLQGTLEQALGRITGETFRVTASGRTDAGVHALGQVVSFRSETHLSPEVLHKALNAELPHDMAVVAAALEADDFHATGSAVRKRYRYVIDDGPTRDVFARRYAWHFRAPLDDRAMHEAALGLLGKHDFSSFETAGSPRETSVRTVFEIIVEREQGTGARRVRLEIEADGFLYNMVRTIVGTLVEVGRGNRPIAWPADVLAARDRKAAGQTAPPHGLFLVRVVYA